MWQNKTLMGLCMQCAHDEPSRTITALLGKLNEITAVKKRKFKSSVNEETVE